MAVLNKIRQRSVFLILIIALALFAFILADLFRNSDALTSKSLNTVATINGKDISREDFLQKVEAAQRQLGQNATNTQAMNLVWEQEVRNAIMHAEYDKLGLTVEKDQIRDILMTNLSNSPEFLNEAGLFDEGRLNEYIATLKETSEEAYQQWVAFESSLSNSELQKNYLNLVKASALGTIVDAKVKYKLETDKVDISYVQIPYNSIADSTVTVTKSEIEAYIKAHKDQFEVEATRNISYVEFKEIASLEDETELQNTLKALIDNRTQYNETTKATDEIPGFAKTEAVEAFVNSNSDIKYVDRLQFKNELPNEFSEQLHNLEIDQVFGPYKDGNFYKISRLVDVKQVADSAKARHILIPFKGAVSAGTDVVKTEEEAKKTADSVLAVVKANRSKFPELVTALSSDQGSVANGGRYDWFPYNRMVPEFRDYVFDNKVGNIGIVKTDFGFHIIEVEGQTTTKKAIKLATIARQIEPSETTVDNVFRDASNFEISLADTSSMAELAEAKGLAVRPVNGIEQLQESIPGLGSQRAIVRWAFEEGVKVGDYKRFNTPNGFAIVQLTASNNAGLMTVEDATLTVLPKLRKQKKAAQIIKRLGNPDNLQSLASSENTSSQNALAITLASPTISGSGREPFVVGYAFGMKEGAISKPLEGENGVYVVQLTKLTPAAEISNFTNYADQVSSARAAAVQTNVYTALKKEAEIEDNRAKTVL